MYFLSSTVHNGNHGNLATMRTLAYFGNACSCAIDIPKHVKGVSVEMPEIVK